MGDGGDIVRRTRVPKGSGHVRRDEILIAAEAIFLQEGYERATVRRIAEAVGLSSTALYMHFENKADLLLEIARRAISELIQHNELISRHRSSPADRIGTMLNAYMNFALTHPHAYQLVFGQPMPLAEESLGDVRAMGAQCFSLFEEVFEELADTGELRGEPLIAAQVAWSAAHGIVSLQINHPKFTWAAGPVTLSEAMLDYLFHGLIAEPRDRGGASEQT